MKANKNTHVAGPEAMSNGSASHILDQPLHPVTTRSVVVSLNPSVAAARSSKALSWPPAAPSGSKGATLGAGQFATVVGALAGTRFLTGLLDPIAYGDLALALTIAGLLSLVASGCIGNAVSRFYAVAHDRENLRCFFRAAAILYGEYQVGLYWLRCGRASNISRISSRGSAGCWQATLGLAAIALALVNGASGMLDAMQNAARHPGLSWHGTRPPGGGSAWPAGAILWIHENGATAANALSGYVAASMLVLGSQCLFFSATLNSLAVGEPSPQRVPVRLLTREMRDYANPFVAFAPIAWLQQASDRWILALFVSHREVGLYQTLNQIGYSPLLQLSGLITLVAAPILFFQVGDGTDDGRMHGARRRVLQLSCLMFIGTLAFAGALWAFGKPLFSLAVAPE